MVKFLRDENGAFYRNGSGAFMDASCEPDCCGGTYGRYLPLCGIGHLRVFGVHTANDFLCNDASIDFLTPGGTVSTTINMASWDDGKVIWDSGYSWWKTRSNWLSDADFIQDMRDGVSGECMRITVTITNVSSSAAALSLAIPRSAALRAIAIVAAVNVTFNDLQFGSWIATDGGTTSYDSFADEDIIDWASVAAGDSVTVTWSIASGLIASEFVQHSGTQPTYTKENGLCLELDAALTGTPPTGTPTGVSVADPDADADCDEGCPCPHAEVEIICDCETANHGPDASAYSGLKDGWSGVAFSPPADLSASWSESVDVTGKAPTFPTGGILNPLMWFGNLTPLRDSVLLSAIDDGNETFRFTVFGTGGTGSYTASLSFVSMLSYVRDDWNTIGISFTAAVAGVHSGILTISMTNPTNGTVSNSVTIPLAAGFVPYSASDALMGNSPLSAYKAVIESCMRF